MVTLFDELSDLSLIEIFSYLSSVDALWSFNNLNTRLTSLLTERGFYRCVNLSSIRRSRFRTFLSLLRLNEIESLLIDCNASSLQVRVWPYRPHLTKLTVKGLRDPVDLFRFVKRQRHTLNHLTIHSSDYSKTCGMTKDVVHPAWNLCRFVTEILHHLTALRSLDLGMETSFFLHHWPFKRIRMPLVNLTVTLGSIITLLPIMSTEPLAQTLQQLRITINDMTNNLYYNFNDISSTPQMKALQVFRIVKAFKCYFGDEWTFVDQITSIKIMPVLQQMSFCTVIKASDFVRMNHSALFTDSRRVDVRFAVIIDDERPHMELLPHVRRFSREIASATFISQFSDGQSFTTPDQLYSNKSRSRQHLFYTLPWHFEEFLLLCVPDRCIDGIEVFTSSSKMIKRSSSRLIKLTMTDNLPSSATIFSHIVHPNQVVELHLFRCDRKIVINLPNLRHLVLTDSLDSLNSSSLSKNIRSIQITLYHQCLRFPTIDWTVLTELSILPLLNSLRILLYNMRIPPDDQSRRILGETASMMVCDFSFCFRRRYYPYVGGHHLSYSKHALFIDQLRTDILALLRNEKVFVFVEEDGCGMRIWF